MNSRSAMPCTHFPGTFVPRLRCTHPARSFRTAESQVPGKLAPEIVAFPQTGWAVLMSHDPRLLLTIGLAVCGLVVLITRFKLHAFIALTLASLLVGVCLGAKPMDVTKAFAEGVGSVLGS